MFQTTPCRYGVNVVTEANSAPGRYNNITLAGCARRRDRHVRMDTHVLGAMLDTIASVDGKVQKYAAVAAARRHYVNDDGSTPTDEAA